MAGQNVRVQLYTACFCHLACTIENGIEAAGGHACVFPDLFDGFREVGNLFDGNHVQLCAFSLARLSANANA